MKLLEEMYGGVRGLDNYDRAVEMIDAAVEHHDRNDNFDAIADIDGLIQFLKGQYHDFTPALENAVREIIADEIGHNEPEEDLAQWKDNYNKGLIPDEEEEEFRGGGKQAAQGPEFRGPGARKNPWRNKKRVEYRNKSGKLHHDTLVKAAKPEEEESTSDRITRMRHENKKVLADLDKRRQARKYGVSGPSSRRSRLGSRARGRLTSTEQEEVASLGDRRTRRDRFRPDVRRHQRGHRHADPGRRMAQLMARKARPHVGLEQEEYSDEVARAQEANLAKLPDCKKCGGTGYEPKGIKRGGRWNCTDCKGTGKNLRARFEQEEKKTNYDMQTTDWNKEVADFRERRKKHEAPSSRSGRIVSHSRRKMRGPSGNAFGLRFESFSSFLEKDDETPGDK